MDRLHCHMSCWDRISRSSLCSVTFHSSHTAATCKQRVGRLPQHLHRFVRGRTTQLDFGNDKIGGLAILCCLKGKEKVVHSRSS